MRRAVLPPARVRVTICELVVGDWLSGPSRACVLGSGGLALEQFSKTGCMWLAQKAQSTDKSKQGKSTRYLR